MDKLKKIGIVVLVCLGCFAGGFILSICISGGRADQEVEKLERELREANKRNDLIEVRISERFSVLDRGVERAKDITGRERQYNFGITEWLVSIEARNDGEIRKLREADTNIRREREELEKILSEN